MSLGFFQLSTMIEDNNNIKFNSIFVNSELMQNTSECQNVTQAQPVALKGKYSMIYIYIHVLKFYQLIMFFSIYF